MKHGAGSDACAVPVLTTNEAASLAAASSSRRGEGFVPSPHPTLERTPSGVPLSDTGSLMVSPGAHTEDILGELDISIEEREALRREGALGDQPTVAKL